MGNTTWKDEVVEEAVDAILAAAKMLGEPAMDLIATDLKDDLATFSDEIRNEIVKAIQSAS